MGRIDATDCPRTAVAARVALAAALLAPGVAPAAEVPEALQIFGHLTQSYGESSRGSIAGTGEDGTTDLRKIAIQLRWTPSENETFIVQLSHERNGDDIFQPQKDEVAIDWAFYQRMLGPQSAVKVGRLNVPLGIYNEVRDVGTVLPFYNLPISFYAGVLSTAETVDGVSFARTFAPRSPWSLEAEVYGGGWDTFQQQVAAASKFGLRSLEARAENGIGLQLWLDTPFNGLRLGAGVLTWLLDGPLSGDDRDRWDAYHLSVDASLERWIFRAEARRWRFDQDFGAFLATGTSIEGRAQREGYYGQLGVWVTPEIGLFAQYEKTSLDDDLGLIPEVDNFHEDVAAAVNYRFRPDLVARVEYHLAHTRFPLGVPELPVMVGAPSVDVNWLIAGLSVSF